MVENIKSSYNQYLGYAIAVAIGGLFTFIINWRSQDRTSYQDLLDRQAIELNELKVRILSLEKENIELTARIEVLTYSSFESPLPAWVKSVDGRMIALNRAYEDLFLIPNNRTVDDYIGKTDEEFWGSLGAPEVGRDYWETDLRVLATEKTIRSIQTGIFNKVKRDLIVYKYPYYTSYGFTGNRRQIVGVAGVAVPMEDNN